jgi:hypothetical protein
MPPYRDPYEDDKELDEADLGNDFDEEKAETSEEEFKSSVEDDDDDVSTNDESSEDDTEKETDETDDEGELEDGDSEREDGDNSEVDDASNEDADSDADDDGDSDDSKEQENQIPQSRFNEVNGNWRRAEERADRLEALLEQTISQLGNSDVRDSADGSEVPEAEAEVDVAAVEKEILELAFAGKEDEAVQRRVELDAYKELQWAEKYGAGDLDTKVATALDTRAEQASLKKVIVTSQEAYPELKEGNKNYNQELVDEINETWDGLSMKMPTSVALEKAVKFVTAAHGMSSAEVNEADTQPVSKGRKKAAVRKNAEAQKRQPPKMRGRSAKDDSLDEVRASKLSDDKLFSMSEKELRILRGD